MGLAGSFGREGVGGVDARTNKERRDAETGGRGIWNLCELKLGVIGPWA
jgi:hypothetical protein